MLLELNKEQQLAFNRLKKAFKDCERLKVLLVNQYGTLCAYDKSKVSGFEVDHFRDPNTMLFSDVTDLFYNPNTINGVCPGMADDEGSWGLTLTRKGMSIYEKESNE